ncbi:MAG: hypothetical protein JW775_02960 [Candidatus Aminicenantes bacterium]|nr:hypothetical protein [Candidatus Aminicenantes bacterium]
MGEDRDRFRRRAATGAALALAFAATWIALSLTDDRPGWLTVWAPEAAAVGRPLEVRVRLGGSIEATEINCTLHRANSERKGWGFLSSSGPSRPAAGGETHAFLFDVPEREDTAYAFALVFLSPTGSWGQATRAATAKYIPVVGATEAPSSALQRTRVYRYPTPAEEVRRRSKARPAGPRKGPSAWIHPALAALLLAGAALCVANGVRERAAGLPPGGAGERAAWLALAAVMAAGAVFELAGIAGRFASWARQMAEARGVYELRRPVQKGLMAAAAAASLGLFLLFMRSVRRPGPHRALWWTGIGVAAYTAVSFVSVVSFHAVDVARSLAWHGLSPVDAVRGAGAAVAFSGTLASLLGKARRRAT